MPRPTSILQEWTAQSALVLGLVALLYALAVLLLRATSSLLQDAFWDDLRRALAALLVLFLLATWGAIVLGFYTVVSAKLKSLRWKGGVAALAGLISMISIAIGQAWMS